MGAVNNRKLFPLSSGIADDGKFTTPSVHDHMFIGGILHDIEIDKLDSALDACTDVRLLYPSTRSTTDMECPHGQLCAGFTDGLGCQDTDSLSHLHLLSVGKIAAITTCAYTMLGFTCQNRTDFCVGYARVFDEIYSRFINFFSSLHQHLIRKWIQNIFERRPP